MQCNAAPSVFVDITGMKILFLPAILCLAGIGVAQTTGSSETKSSGPSAKQDLGSAAGDSGKGAAKGAGSAAKGTAKAAVDLVTLHPINAATGLGKGAVNT